jgi:hypothetical protein
MTCLELGLGTAEWWMPGEQFLVTKKGDHASLGGEGMAEPETARKPKV